MYIDLLKFLQVLNLPQKVKISKIEVVDETIWIATIGSGIYVYSTRTFNCHSSWGVSNKENVFNLLYIEDMSLIVALTITGIYSFSTVIKGDFHYLEPSNYLKEKISPLSINVGICIPCELNINSSEVWVCSHTRCEFFVIEPSTLTIIEASIGSMSERSDQMSINHNILHLEIMKISGRMKLAVADNWILHLWDIERREIEKSFNCQEEKGLNTYKLSGIFKQK